MRRDLRAGLQLLTRLPVAWIERTEAAPDLSRAAWAFPLVGLLVGGVGAAVFALLAHVGEPPVLAALLGVAAQVALTGALHEDGLADTADGLGGGRTRERKLDIMRDSRIGAYGVLALVFSTGARIAALAALGAIGPTAAARALLAAGCLGRGAIVLLPVLLRPARADGLAASLRRRGAATAAGLLIAGLAPLPLLGLSGWASALLAALAATLLLARLARRQIGGFTGDVLGAASVLAECVVLTVLARST
jgi:adenosylcobinamide-GDP ribazoletransferase